MSIVLGAAQPVEINLLWPVAAMGVSALLVWRTGVLARNSILGPRRLSPDESPGRVLLILLIAVVAALMAVEVYASMRAPHAGVRDAFARPAFEPLSDVEKLTAGYIQSVAVIAAVLVATLLLRQEGFDRLGLRWRQIVPGVIVAIVGLLIILPAIFWTEYYTQVALDRFNIWHPLEHPLFDFMRDDHKPGLRWAAILSAVTLGPVAEELLFRGLAQTVLRYWTRRPWVAVLIASALFAALHPWWSQPAIFVLAIGLGYVYERTGNLWASIFLHAGFNAAQVCLFFLTV